jgi:hypothetical protein
MSSFPIRTRIYGNSSGKGVIGLPSFNEHKLFSPMPFAAAFCLVGEEAILKAVTSRDLILCL